MNKNKRLIVSKQNYIDKANIKFNYKFDYSKFDYKSAKIKSVIICPIHGETLQNMDKHTNGVYGCDYCWQENRPFPQHLVDNIKEIIPFEIFKNNAIKKFGDKYKYDDKSYFGMSKKIDVICSEHGKFSLYPRYFLKSQIGCPKCSMHHVGKLKIKPYEYFINQANLKYNNFYIYPISNKEIYINKKSIINIDCPKHGSFKKKAQKHLAGQGCYECKIEELVKNNVLVGGYSEKLFFDKPFLKDKEAFVYFLSINNNEFFKVGITTLDVKKRVNAIKLKAKSKGFNIDIDIVKTKKGTLYECFKLEQLILEKNNEDRLFTTWSKELLKTNIHEQYF